MEWKEVQVRRPPPPPPPARCTPRLERRKANAPRASHRARWLAAAWLHARAPNQAKHARQTMQDTRAEASPPPRSALSPCCSADRLCVRRRRLRAVAPPAASPRAADAELPWQLHALGGRRARGQVRA
eukprot:102550-Prymnesium_polylepis.1